METVSLKSTIEQLDKLFEKVNNRFFNNELQKPVIAVNSEGGTNSYGWLTLWKSWKESTNKDDDNNGHYELNMCAEALHRPLGDVLGTLIHECVHLYNLQNEIKDTSRGNTYHNKKFKEEAEKRGLTIERHDKYGWTITTLNEEGKEFLETITDTNFELHRTPMNVVEKLKVKKKSSSKKYVCSGCGLIIRATKEVNIKCGDCDIVMECDEE